MVVGLQMRQRIPLSLFRNKRPKTNYNRSRVVPRKKKFPEVFQVSRSGNQCYSAKRRSRAKSLSILTKAHVSSVKCR